MFRTHLRNIPSTVRSNIIKLSYGLLKSQQFSILSLEHKTRDTEILALIFKSSPKLYLLLLRVLPACCAFYGIYLFFLLKHRCLCCIVFIWTSQISIQLLCACKYNHFACKARRKQPLSAEIAKRKKKKKKKIGVCVNKHSVIDASSLRLISEILAL